MVKLRGEPRFLTAILNLNEIMYVNFYNSYHLLSTYYVPGMDLNFLHALIYSVLIIAL